MIGIGIAIGIAIGIGIGFGALVNSSPNVEKQIEEQNEVISALKSQLESANEKIETLVQPMDSMMGPSVMEGIQFNPDAPITIPMIDGYYNGERVFFIHTEVSDKGMAEMMTKMINFPTLHLPELTNISREKLGNVYVFKNGIPGSGPYGGGPFMFQIDIFDSIPGEEGYSQFRVPHLVTWNDNATPRILTSLEDLLGSTANGELTIQETDNVVNAPMIVWDDENGKQQVASMIGTMFVGMPTFTGQVINVDIDNYIVRIKLNSM